MPTVSVYLSDADYDYYRSLDNKAAVLKWALTQHRKAAEKLKQQDKEQSDDEPVD